MISDKVFKQTMQEIQTTLGLDAKTDYLLVMYKYLAPEFDDNSFRNAATKVLQNEELFGKMPNVRHFTKYLPPKITDDEEREAKKASFLEKVSNYLMCGFITDYDREQLKGLSELECRTLQANGGLSEMWSRVHNLDYPCRISTIIRELSEFYDNNYTRENVEQRKVLENRSGGMKAIGQTFGFLADLSDREGNKNGKFN